MSESSWSSCRRAGASLDLDEVRTLLGQRLMKHKVPRQVAVWESIPKTSVGNMTKDR